MTPSFDPPDIWRVKRGAWGRNRPVVESSRRVACKPAPFGRALPKPLFALI
jgi:hypothetical protein